MSQSVKPTLHPGVTFINMDAANGIQCVSCPHGVKATFGIMLKSEPPQATEKDQVFSFYCLFHFVRLAERAVRKFKELEAAGRLRILAPEAAQLKKVQP